MVMGMSYRGRDLYFISSLGRVRGIDQTGLRFTADHIVQSLTLSAIQIWSQCFVQSAAVRAVLV